MAQHPDFDRFMQQYDAGQYETALDILDGLIASHPQSASLHWHRANCLEKLERHEEVPAALNRLIEKRPDYSPALIRRVEYSGWELDALAPEPDIDDDADEENLPPAARAALAKRSALEKSLEQRSERDLREVLKRDSAHAQASYMLSCLLRYRESEAGQDDSAAEAATLLDRAIALAPGNTEYRAERAGLRRMQAMLTTEASDDNAAAAGVVQTFSGMCYDRTALEAAASDYEACWQLEKQPRHAIRLAGILHDLGRFDDALRCYDNALAEMAADDPMRDYVMERRAASTGNGAGEREQMAQMLLGSLDDTPGKNRTLEEDMAAQAIIGAAEAIRRGEDISTALAANVSDDPDTMTAMNLARQILNVAYEPAPGLVEVKAADYPAWQRRHCDQVAKAAAPLGMTKIADAEAMAMFNMLGQHVLLRLFRNADGDIGMASFILKPKWPGMIVFLIMLLTGKWKAQKMTECVTHFDDGGMISTQPESISPFEYGGNIIINKLPAKATVADIVQHHAASVAEYRHAHPHATPMYVTDLAGVEERWVAGQEAKSAWRQSVGYATDAELHKLLGAHYDQFADKVRTQLKLMAP
ncbi:MAG: tetratricopeptide repeat protein [Moraxellaceae bacterium]|nr:tetratricopeptide repeat protein [Moraxellaceae bacterium]